MKRFLTRIRPWLFSVLLGLTGLPTATAATFYVDDTGGADTADGEAAASAWKTLSRANAAVFHAGDKLLLKSGGHWMGQLHPQGSGARGNPIVIDQYGTGGRPVIAGGGTVDAAVRLFNQTDWEINGLELTNTAAAAGDFRGISIEGCDAGTLGHVYIQGCYVHHVTGETRYFGSGTGAYEIGKRTGGIVFWTDTLTGVKTRFDDVLIQGNTIANNSFGGIVFKQTNKHQWALREGGVNDPNWYPHTHVQIRDNFIDQSGSANNLVAVLLTAVRDVLVSGNLLKDAHQCGIELDYAEDCVVEKNEVYRTTKGATGTDSCALDFDRCCNRTIWQYNYLNENGVGILACHGINAWDFGSDNHVRYNVFQNCSGKCIFLVSRGGPDFIYNNVFYNDKFANVALVDQPARKEGAPVRITNNIFYQTTPGGKFSESANIRYEANTYAGNLRAVAGDAHAVTADPRFTDPGKGGIGQEGALAFGSLDGYRLRKDSPCLRAGVSMPDNGGRDFWGTKLEAEKPAIGVYEPAIPFPP